MPDDAGGAEIRLVLQSDAHSVRAALIDLFGRGALHRLPGPDRHTAEIVLAEVLNNIVEHACALVQSEIEVTIRREADGLACKVVDHGARMPQGRLPGGTLPLASGDSIDLPEGGFGWYLIRHLARDLTYRRVGDRNEFSFRLRMGQ